MCFSTEKEKVEAEFDLCILHILRVYNYILSTMCSVPSPVEHQICPAVCVLMKLSFDEEHRHAMNELGESEKQRAV